MFEKRLRVLLVEDEPNDVLIIKYFLGSEDSDWIFEVSTAGTLGDGCRLVEREYFDALLLDLQLPDSAGIDSLLKVRDLKPDLPVIVLTGLKDEKAALDSLALGAQDYLIKGMVNGYFLKRAVTHAVERAKQTKELEGILARDPDGKVIVNQEGLICYANPSAEALLGRRAKDLIGKPFTYPLPPAGAVQVRAAGPGAREKIVEVRATDIEWRRVPARLAVLRDVTPKTAAPAPRLRSHNGQKKSPRGVHLPAG